MSFTFSTTYKLDKAYYIECYQQTAKQQTTLKAYTKALFILLLGLLVSTLGQQGHLALFIVALSVIEGLSVFFAQTWWVWRQLISRVANSEVSLTVDQQGIKTDSGLQQFTILWSNVSDIAVTEKGLVIVTNNNRTYLSAAVLSNEAYQFILANKPQAESAAKN